MSVNTRSRLLLALGLVAPALAACDLSSHVLALSISGAVADTTISLGVGQEARVAGTALRFTFLGVINDSRCPRDVMCVWAGNAVVDIGASVGMGPTVRYTLNTSVDPRSVNVGGYRITLLDLQPYPVLTTTIPPRGYVATFRLERLVYGPD